MFKNGWIDVMGRRVRADRTNEEDRNRRPINQQSTVTHISNLGSAIVVTRTDKAGDQRWVAIVTLVVVYWMDEWSIGLALDAPTVRNMEHRGEILFME